MHIVTTAKNQMSCVRINKKVYKRPILLTALNKLGKINTEFSSVLNERSGTENIAVSHHLHHLYFNDHFHQ